MELISHTIPKMVISSKGTKIRAKNDAYVPEYTDEEGNIATEHIPYYTTTIFVPDSYTKEQMEQDYVEEEIEESEVQ